TRRRGRPPPRPRAPRAPHRGRLVLTGRARGRGRRRGHGPRRPAHRTRRRGGRRGGRLAPQARPAMKSTATLALVLALGLSLTAALAAPTRAEPGDYLPDDEAWNGIGYLLETAREAKVEVEATDELDLSRLRPSHTLFWLFPEQDLPVDALLGFVEDGGH